MPTTTTFLRLLADEDKGVAAREALAALGAGQPAANAYTVDPASFHQIPGSPFAYWVSERLRGMYGDFPLLESGDRKVRRGPDTGDDFRFLRLTWEVAPLAIVGGNGRTPTSDFVNQTLRGKRWALFVKGGDYSPYYSDLALVMDWSENGRALKTFVGSNIRSPEDYFRSGLTYPRRTTSGLSVRVMPTGSIFGDKGPAMLVAGDDSTELLSLLAIANSAPFAARLALQLGAATAAARSYEVGLIQQMPVPAFGEADANTLAALSREAHDRKREADRDDEVTHAFTAPALDRLRAAGSLAAAAEALTREREARERRLAAIQREIDDRCFALYGFSAEDRAQIERGESPTGARQGDIAEDVGSAEDADDGDEEEQASTGVDMRRAVADLLMYALGCAFGRWDLRIGRNPTLAPPLADAFAPLPVCAPGALVGPDGLPATDESIASEEWLRARPDAITPVAVGSVAHPAITAEAYPLPVAWQGILADDPASQMDILRAVRAVLDDLWGDRAEAIEAEARAILGVNDLRDYLRNPRGFFDHHISRYSKSRRKAPIYWLLQSPRRSYALWISYHRLDGDLLYKALTLHLLPKIRQEETRLAEAQGARQATGADSSEARRLGREIERQAALLDDLREFQRRLERTAPLLSAPDLNDGVALNIAPLRELVPWKESKAKWEELSAGKYAWSTISQQLRHKCIIHAPKQPSGGAD